MNRKLIVIGLGGALVLAVTVLVANRSSKGELRAASKPHVDTQNGQLTFTPTNNYWKATIIYHDDRKASTTPQPKKP